MKDSFIYIHNLTFGYQSSTTTLFRSVELQFEIGWTGVVGANGSGKSTLLKIITGELTPVSGSLNIPYSSYYCEQHTDYIPDNASEFLHSYDKYANQIINTLHIQQEWQDRWRAQSSQDEFPVFINKYATDYLTQWHAIRKSDYLAIVVVDNEGALVLSSFPQVGFFHGKSLWWQAVMYQRETQAFVSDLSFDPGFGTHVLNVAVPIWGASGNATPVLCISPRFTSFSVLIESITLL